MNQHPLSAAFPAMSREDLAILQADMKAQGQLQPIITFDGLVLDGWHRYTVCMNLGITPRTEPLGEGLDPVAYVQSVNLHRRHLTGSQRAAAVTACAAWMPSHRPNKGEPGSPLTVSDMAKAADVSERTIQQAKKAQEAGLGDAVRDGKVTAKQASEIAKLPELERAAAIEAPPTPKTPHPKAPKTPPASSETTASAGNQTNPPPAPKDDRDARISQLERLVEERDKEIAALKEEVEHLRELAGGMADDQEEIASLRKVLDADDRLRAMMDENRQARAQARVNKSRNDGLINENADLTKFLKSALRKVERLEKKFKASEGQGAGSEPEPTFNEADEYMATFGEAG